MKRLSSFLAISVLAACTQSATPASVRTLEAFTLESPGITFPTESSLQLKAWGHYSDGTRVDLTTRTAWTSSVPSVGHIGASGIVSLGGVGASRFEGRFEDRLVAVTLFASAATLTGLEVGSVDRGELARGDARRFTAKARYSDGSTLDVTARTQWTVDGSVLGTSDTAGLVVGRAQGEGVVQAHFGAQQVSTRVQVVGPRYRSLELSFPSTVIRPGDLHVLTAWATYSDGSAREVTNEATWTSSDETVFSVAADRLGLVVAQAPGRARITATWHGSNASVQLQSMARAVVGLDFERSSVQLAQGLSVRVGLFAQLDDGSRAFVSDSAQWSSSQPAVATVSDEVTSKGVVQAVALGSATISAEFGGLVATYTFETTSAVLTSLDTTLAGGRLLVGQSADFKVRGSYSDGAVVNLSSEVTIQHGPWLVSGLVQDRVRVTAAELGPTMVALEFGGLVHQVAFEVSDATVTQIEVRRLSNLGHTTGPTVTPQRFQAWATYSDGVVAEVTELCNWWLDDAEVAVLSDEPGSRGAYGLANGGTTAVRATFNGEIATLVWAFPSNP